MCGNEMADTMEPSLSILLITTSIVSHGCLVSYIYVLVTHNLAFYLYGIYHLDNRVLRFNWKFKHIIIFRYPSKLK